MERFWVFPKPVQNSRVGKRFFFLKTNPFYTCFGNILISLRRHGQVRLPEVNESYVCVNNSISITCDYVTCFRLNGSFVYAHVKVWKQRECTGIIPSVVLPKGSIQPIVGSRTYWLVPSTNITWSGTHSKKTRCTVLGAILENTSIPAYCDLFFKFVWNR